MQIKHLICFLFLFPGLASFREGLSQSLAGSGLEKNTANFSLMPVPEKVTAREGSFRLDKNFALEIKGTHERLYNASNRFLRRLDGRTGLFFTQGIISKRDPQKHGAPSLFIIAHQEGKIELHEDESYHLIVGSEKISLEAPNDLGILRGLETLLQLLQNDGSGYFFPSVEITDKPRFPWRGLMIDVARHYQPMGVLKRNLDAMAAVKMNVLHIHLCDDQGWRVESKIYPKLHLLATDGLYYTHEQIRELVEYASDRGIRVMPEFDVPGHATAILVAYPELGSAPGPYKLERASGVFDPVLNPVSDETYTFLSRLFREMSALFPDPYFHIGGDENNGVHWKANPEIQAFMKKNNLPRILDLQTYFSNRLIKSIRGMDRNMVGWEEILQPGLAKDAVIHSWKGRESLYKAAMQGYQTILSNGFYIDLMLPASGHYANDPLPPDSLKSEKERKYKLSPEQEKLILGGEATMWSELVTSETIDSRIWPRTAAIAERLWSPSSVRDEQDMYRRLERISFLLEEHGLTHIRNRDVILRNLANGGEIFSLQVLARATGPYTYYTRNNGGRMYMTYSPFTLMADAVSADATDARTFARLVHEYSVRPDEEGREKIMQYLSLWQNNHDLFLAVMARSPVLKPMEKLSYNLSVAGTIGLEALRAGKTSGSWYEEKSRIIQKMKAESIQKKNSDKTFEDGRTELRMLDPLQKLLDLTNQEAARKRSE